MNAIFFILVFQVWFLVSVVSRKKQARYINQ